jgi:BirA family biotin operon repressor/biotin-[acetyl-CoA-carboxylase] ligase
MTRAARELGVGRAALKWPNDVLVDGRKLSGVLTELTPHGVVIGAGVNLTMSEEQLPVPTATSLTLEGVSLDEAGDAADASLTDRALAAYLRALLDLVAQWREAPTAGALRALVEPVLATLGAAVRVDQPGLPPLRGTAVGLDDDGRLLVRDADGSSSADVAVSAGDVTHLRYE